VIRAAARNDILDMRRLYVRALVCPCTVTSEENDKVIGTFLERSGDFVLDDPRLSLPAGAGGLVGDDMFLRTFPSVHGTDGFFAARLKRRPRTGIVSV
jgi:16S rRNA (cytosine967-C5)-methyltransferase